MKQEGSGELDPLEYLKPNVQKKVEPLLKYVQKKGITWNEDGEVEGLPRSNIVDLLKDAVIKTKMQPKGITEFYIKLGNVPQSLILNPLRREAMNSIPEEKEPEEKKPEENKIESVPAPPPGKREYKKQMKKVLYNK